MAKNTVDAGGESSDDGLAPVIPLFGSREPARERGAAARPGAWHTTWSEDVSDDARDRRDDGGGTGDRSGAPSDAPERRSHGVSFDGASSDEHRVPAAEKLLLRRLRGRSLSIVEARAVLAQADLEAHEVDGVIDDFQRRGYLDDRALAEQIVHIGVDRKGQGRQAIAMTLSSRGIPRDVADAALTAMPDDEAERALDYAASKARSLRDLDHNTALRRLVGQLARRGYSGSVALAAARQALASSRASSGVRFD